MDDATRWAQKAQAYAAAELAEADAARTRARLDRLAGRVREAAAAEHSAIALERAAQSQRMIAEELRADLPVASEQAADGPRARQATPA